MFLPPSKLVVAVSVFKNMIARGFSLSKFGSRNVHTSQVIKDREVMGTTFVDPILPIMGRCLDISLLVLDPLRRKQQAKKIGQFAHNTNKTCSLVSFC